MWLVGFVVVVISFGSERKIKINYFCGWFIAE